jgi:hypothetical protein
MVVVNKYSSKLKDMSVEMPNAPYSNRYGQFQNKDNGQLGTVRELLIN